MTETLENRLEQNLRLPVVTTPSGKIAVLEKYIRDVEFVDSDEALALFDTSLESISSKSNKMLGIVQKLSSLREKSSMREKRRLNLRLYFCPCRVSYSVAHRAIKKICSLKNMISKMHLIIDFGANAIDWQNILDLIMSMRAQSKPDFPIEILIDGSFTSCPSKDIMDFLVKHGVILRYVLGGTLGYSSILNPKSVKVLRSASDYGLRIPVLFYWAGEEPLFIKELLDKALQANSLSGVSVLPAFLSPYYDIKNINGHFENASFRNVVDLLYSDKLISELIEEPIVDLEDRLSDSSKINRICALINDRGEISPFRSFPLVIRDRKSKSNYVHEKNMKLLLYPERIPMYSRCKKCVWKHICGGIDTCITHRNYHEILANIWCEYRQIYLRRISQECLIIREHISNYSLVGKGEN